MVLERYLLLQVDRTSIKIGNGFKQGDRDEDYPLKDLPGN